MNKERHTYNMGIIGNCSYMAYVGLDADVRWMCWPRFDSSYIFGSLLDEEKGGHFYIRPKSENYKSRQYYLQNTNVLCTEFECDDGRFRITDFAPRFYHYERYFKPLMLIRKIEPLEGHPEIIVSCQPMGDYGNITPKPQFGSNHIEYHGLERQVRLTTNFPLNFVTTSKPMILDKARHCILTYGVPLEAPLEATAEEFLRKTTDYWQDWINSASIPAFYQKEVIRSALVLKLHQYEDTGAVIAAGTTSLPEYPGEGRNWDYRYCWLRDSYYTIRMFNNLGHFDEARRFSNFIQNVAGVSAERYQPLYSITGEVDVLIEKELDLKGYQGNNQPVRIGNQAAEHIQNDVYGQVLVSLLPLYADERFVEKDRTLALKNTYAVLEKIERTIDEEDAGLWEFRNKQQKHCYTFLFHWAGSNAAAKIGKYFGEPELVKRAERLIGASEKNIEQCYDEQAKVYRQAIGSKNLDASLFQMVTMNYLDPASPKTFHHIEELEKALRGDAKKHLIYRYKHVDDFGMPHSTFVVCAFWYVEALAYVGRVDAAIETFEELLKCCNHLGLFSEDIEAETGSQWGNFPQTYSHVGLANAAYMIANKMNKPDFLVY